MDPIGSPYQVSRSQLGAAAPSFLVRVFALPFWPRLWREVPESGIGAVVVAILVWGLLAGIVGGIRAADAAHKAVYDFAKYYQENADPLLLDNGRFSLTGERILRLEDPNDGSLFLIDPAETVPDSELTGSRYVVVRSDRIVIVQPTQTRIYSAAQASELFGQHVLFDADWLRHAADRWLYPSLAIGYPLLVALIDLGACFLYACLVGLLLMLVRGQWLGLGYGACLGVALATSTVTIVVAFVLSHFGVVPPLPGFALWPVLMAALGLAALAGRRAPDSPAPA